MIQKEGYNYNWLLLIRISLVAAMGGLLFGYDWVVIGGAKPFYELYFGISENAGLQGWVMSCALVGCLMGVLASGAMSDRFGRKKLLLLSAALFIVASIGTGYSDTLNEFIIYRIIGGIGIGLASNLSPLYIAEITPANVRGRFVSINQLTLVIGILAAQLINWQIAEPVAENISSSDLLLSWNVQTGWRYMFYICAIPALLFFLLMWLVPESPRWLVQRKSNTALAKKILASIGGSDFAEAEIQGFHNENKLNPAVGISAVKDSKYHKIIFIGIVIAVFQQWCGINVIFNYADEIFSQAGYGVSDILFNIVITGVVNLIFTIAGMLTVDKWGRRFLMLAGSAALAIVYTCMGFLYYFNVQGLPLLILVVLGIGSFAMTLGPVTWVLLSEIFPGRIRAVAMSIATFALWVACFVLTYTFPLLNKWLEASGTFWLYGIICVAGGLFVYKNLKETKGRSLEEIEQDLN